jgi:hypothetical protein
LASAEDEILGKVLSRGIFAQEAIVINAIIAQVVECQEFIQLLRMISL